MDLTDLVGAVGRAHLVVGPEQTAAAVGSGDLPVLGTPVMIALMESAACDAVAGRLPDGHTSVGTRVEVRHRVPSPLGAEVTAHATVTAANGRTIEFAVTAVHDVEGITTPIGDGTHARAVVERATFAR